MPSRKRLTREEAAQVANQALEQLAPSISYGTVVGSYRRHLDDPDVHEFGDVDLLVVPVNPVPDLPKDWQVDVFASPPESVEPALVHWLLGKNILRVKALARQRGWRLNRYGLWKSPDEPPITDAYAIYKELDLGEPPPYVKQEVAKWRQSKADDEEQVKQANYWKQLFYEVGDIFSPSFAMRNPDISWHLYSDDWKDVAAGLFAAMIRRRWERRMVEENNRYWVNYFADPSRASFMRPFQE
jgi:hypothetical protein